MALQHKKKKGSVVRSIKRAALPILLVILGLSLVLVSYVSLRDPTENSLVSLSELEKIDSGLPVRIIIPTIAVDTSLEHVGLGPGGVMGAPESPDNGAWLKYGPLPGEEGSSVIAGHYGWTNRKAAVFDNLNTLKKGDKVYVVNDRDEVVSFVVREIRSYDPHMDASDVFSSDDGRAHLNLVTCEGAWNKDQQSYSKRLVVFTDKE